MDNMENGNRHLRHCTLKAGPQRQDSLQASEKEDWGHRHWSDKLRENMFGGTPTWDSGNPQLEDGAYGHIEDTSGWHVEPSERAKFYKDQSKSKFRKRQASPFDIQAMIAVPFDVDFIGKLGATIGVTPLVVEGFDNSLGKRYCERANTSSMSSSKSSSHISP